jgi:hypothetical protein
VVSLKFRSRKKRESLSYLHGSSSTSMMVTVYFKLVLLRLFPMYGMILVMVGPFLSNNSMEGGISRSKKEHVF